jgi:hypothetical protein
MNELIITSISLLVLVVLDAVGDAFRLRKWNVLHHVFEVFHVAGFFAIWALFSFDIIWVPIYILCRIVVFDIVFNVVAGLPITYIGTNSLYDIFVTKLGGWVKQHPGHFAFIFRFMALVALIGLLIKIL